MTRSRSERLEASSCFFWRVISLDGVLRWIGYYFEGAAAMLLGVGPVVVEIEADEAEDGEFEEDFPARHETAV